MKLPRDMSDEELDAFMDALDEDVLGKLEEPDLKVMARRGRRRGEDMLEDSILPWAENNVEVVGQSLRKVAPALSTLLSSFATSMDVPEGVLPALAELSKRISTIAIYAALNRKDVPDIFKSAFGE